MEVNGAYAKIQRNLNVMPVNMRLVKTDSLTDLLCVKLYLISQLHCHEDSLSSSNYL